MKKLTVDPSKRHLMLGTAAATAALLVDSTTSAVAAEPHHKHHQKIDDLLIEVSNECVQTGRACLSHCYILVGNDDTSIANCLKVVAETIAICETFTQLLTLGSKHAKAYTEICSTVCKECEEQCRKHEKMHRECKECADACAVMIKAIKKSMT